MRFILKFIVLIIVLIIAALIAIPVFVSDQTIKEQAQKRVSEATGRKLTIAGDTKFTMFPILGVTLHDTTLSNAEWGEAPYLFKAQELKAGVQLLPLLTGVFILDEMKINAADVFLEVDKEGRKNWQFGALNSAEKTTEPGKPLNLPKKLSLGEIAITNSNVLYTDKQKNAKHQVTNANIKLTLGNLQGPIDLQAKADYQGTPVALNVNANPGIALVTGGTAETTINGYYGTYQAKAKGSLTRQDKIISFKSMELDYAGTVLRGDIVVDQSAAVPLIKADLTSTNLDIDAILAASATGLDSTTATPVEKAPEKPIDLSGLKSLNATIKLKADQAKISKIQFGATNIDANLKDGVLDISGNDIALYGGLLNLKSEISGQNGAKIASRIALQNVQFGPLLKDAADFVYLDGAGNFDATLHTEGTSTLQLKRNLNGDLALAVPEGKVTGLSVLSQMSHVTSAVQNLRDQFASSNVSSEAPEIMNVKTTADIKNGVVSTKDFKLESPNMVLSGEGSADIAQRMIDFKLTPKLGEKRGASVGSKFVGIKVPLRIQGSFDAPMVYPDVAGTAKSAVRDALKNVKSVEDLKSKDTLRSIKDSFKGLISDDAEEKPAAKKVPTPQVEEKSEEPQTPAQEGPTGTLLDEPLKQIQGLF